MVSNNNGKCICCICPVSLGIAFGVASAIYMLVVAWAGWLGGYGKSIIELWSATYPGFAPTFVGGLAAGVWGLVYGFIFGAISAVVYNTVLRCGKRGCDSGSCGSSGKKG